MLSPKFLDLQTALQYLRLLLLAWPSRARKRWCEVLRGYYEADQRVGIEDFMNILHPLERSFEILQLYLKFEYLPTPRKKF